jgi:hypothetical protein
VNLPKVVAVPFGALTLIRPVVAPRGTTIEIVVPDSSLKGALFLPMATLLA